MVDKRNVRPDQAHGPSRLASKNRHEQPGMGMAPMPGCFFMRESIQLELNNNTFFIPLIIEIYCVYINKNSKGGINMKRSLAVVLSLVLVVILAGPVLANGNAYGSMKQSSNLQKMQNMQTVKFQNQNWGLQQRVNASLQQQFRTNMKANKGFNKSPFKDVGSHWASNYIGSMYNIGLFQGYPDGSFRPDQQLSQAEALSLIMRIAAEATTGDEDDYYTGYSNVPSWLQQDYYKAYQRNIIPTNGFNCYGQASRVQTAVMIAKALGLEPVDTSDIP
ncbi:MAG TPA: hypothetical protein DD811_15100, partial [Syntrophomonas sp.]|nr:hypothetical protein [Syntrophomonas sp.]